MTQLTRSLSAHLIWRGFGLISNLIITIVLSRLLAAADSGKFFYFLSWLSLIILIGSLGTEPAITYFLASKKMNKQDLFPLAFSCIVVVLSLIGFVGVLSNLYSFHSAGLIRSGFYFIAGQLMISFFTAFFYGEHKFILPAKIIFLTNLTYIIFLFSLILLRQQPLSNKMITDSYIFLILIQGLLMMGMVINDIGIYRIKFKSDILTLRTIFNYSFPVFGANILIFLATRIDYWLLNHYKQDAVSVGNYIQVSRIAQVFQLFPSMLAAFLFPSVAAGKEQMNTYIMKLSRSVLWMNLLLILMIVIFGKLLFPLMLGNSFEQMYSLFILMIPGIISLSLLAIVSTYFSGNNRVIINLMVSLIGLICVFLGNWFSIPFYGVKAASVVSSVGYTICFVVTWLLFSIHTKNKILNLFEFKRSDFNFIILPLKKIFKQH
jgi:O-antigen/teichoic acid export membrane protein